MSENLVHVAGLPDHLGSNDSIAWRYRLHEGSFEGVERLVLDLGPVGSALKHGGFSGLIVDECVGDRTTLKPQLRAFGESGLVTGKVQRGSLVEPHIMYPTGNHCWPRPTQDPVLVLNVNRNELGSRVSDRPRGTPREKAWADGVDAAVRRGLLTAALTNFALWSCPRVTVKYAPPQPAEASLIKRTTRFIGVASRVVEPLVFLRDA